MTTRDPDTGYVEHHPRCAIAADWMWIDDECTCDLERELDRDDEVDGVLQERKDGER